MANEHDKILVGKIVAPQGIRGDVRVQTYSENPEDFQKFRVFVVIPGERSEGKESKFSENAFKFIRAVPNSNVIIAHIAGVDDRNTAESLRGTKLFISRDSLPPVKDGEYYQTDLIDFVVMRDGEQIGTVAGFQNFGAGDIIELENGDYVSFIGANVDMKQKTIIVK